MTLHLLGGGVQESVWSSWCSPVMDPVGDSYLLFGALQQFSGVLRPVHTQEKRVNDKHQSIFSLSLGVNGPLRQQQDDRSAGFQLYGQRKVGANKSWPSSRCEAKLSEKRNFFFFSESFREQFAIFLPFMYCKLKTKASMGELLKSDTILYHHDKYVIYSVKRN